MQGGEGLWRGALVGGLCGAVGGFWAARAALRGGPGTPCALWEAGRWATGAALSPLKGPRCHLEPAAAAARRELAMRVLAGLLRLRVHVVAARGRERVVGDLLQREHHPGQRDEPGHTERVVERRDQQRHGLRVDVQHRVQHVEVIPQPGEARHSWRARHPFDAVRGVASSGRDFRR
eukprot:scaffold39115_cov65-Phaeocystis_antarctica.AAC.7